MTEKETYNETGNTWVITVGFFLRSVLFFCDFFSNFFSNFHFGAVQASRSRRSRISREACRTRSSWARRLKFGMETKGGEWQGDS